MFSLSRLDSTLDQQRIAGAEVTRIRGNRESMDQLSQEMAGCDGPQFEKTEVDGKVITTYLGIPIGVDEKIGRGRFVVLDMERRVQ